MQHRNNSYAFILLPFDHRCISRRGQMRRAISYTAPPAVLVYSSEGSALLQRAIRGRHCINNIYSVLPPKFKLVTSPAIRPAAGGGLSQPRGDHRQYTVLEGTKYYLLQSLTPILGFYVLRNVSLFLWDDGSPTVVHFG